MRALLIQTADDVDWVGHAPTGLSNPAMTNDDGPVSDFPGPDFATGWGLINPTGAVRSIRARSIGEATIRDNGQVREFTFETGDDSDVRVTLAWDDPAADPSLPLTEPHLVNDLDLELVDPAGQVHYPFALDQKIVSASDPTKVLTPEEQTPGVEVKVQRAIVPVLDPSAEGIDYPHHDIPVAPATRGRDHLNNVEQVLGRGRREVGDPRDGLRPARHPPALLYRRAARARSRTVGVRGPHGFDAQGDEAGGFPTDGLTPSSLGIAVEDFRDPAPVVSHDAPPVLPVGKTTVTFKATDAAGNAATFPVDVTITPFGT